MEKESKYIHEKIKSCSYFITNFSPLAKRFKMNGHRTLISSPGCDLWLEYNRWMRFNEPNKHLPIQSQHRNARKRCEICSKLIIKPSERRHGCRSGIFIVNFEHVSRLFLVFLLLTLNR